MQFRLSFKHLARTAAVLGAALVLASPVPAQIRSVDPAADIIQPNATQQMSGQQKPEQSASDTVASDTSNLPPVADETVPASGTPPVIAPSENGTYQKDDVITAAEGVFGKGAAGLGAMVEKILKEQGEPNAYITGREASGAFILGVRYGSGTMTHSVEGQRPVHWTGPSIGFDAGGDATKVFVLVYNLYDSQDLYKRYAQVEGRAYFVGGLSGTYLRRGNVAMIPIRLGVGMRLGANIGYMKFSEKSKWLPL
jgi:hypothetical protein